MPCSNQPLPETETMLPDDFVPGINHVIIGRGKKSYNHCGNLKFREIIQSRLEEYSLAQSRSAKSSILMDIVRDIHATGGFIKTNSSTGRWMTAGSFLAREKTSQTFRDILIDGYKSSKVSKKKRRQEKVVTSAPMETTRSFKRQRCDTRKPADDIDNLSLLLEDHFLSNESGETMPYDADSDLFASLSSIVSPFIDEHDMNPFEPTPLAEDLCDNDDISMTPSPSIEQVSTKMFDMSELNFIDDLKQGKSLLPTFTPTSRAEFSDFSPVRNTSTARTA